MNNFVCVYLFSLPVAYLGFYFGGSSKYFCNSGGICMALRVEATRLLGGFGGMFPRENFQKWCNLVHFGEYFAKVL